jgi:RNA-directed DNA polymerase
MEVQRQEVGVYRGRKRNEDSVSRGPGATGEGGTGPGACVEQQSFTASTEGRALAQNLMERICDRANLNQAYKRVKANKGSPGMDGRLATGA